MNIRRLEDFVSPQIGATTARQPQLSEERYIEGMAEELPAMEQAQYNRDVTEQQIALDKESRQQARRDSLLSLGIEGANLGVKAYPYLSKIAGIGARTAATATQAGITSEAALGTEVSTQTAATGGGGFLSSLAYGVPTAAGFGAAKVGGDKFTREIGKLGGLVKGKTAQKRIGGTLKGAAAGAAASAAVGSIIPGVGTIAGGIYGAISGFLGSL